MERMQEHVEFLKAFLESSLELETGCRRLVDHCRALAPEGPWELLDGIDWKRDEKSFASWLQGNIPARPQFAAYYLGISEDGSNVHLDGCPAFDPEDAGCDWACDWVYRSEDDWMDSQGLQAFAAISEEADGEDPVLLYLLCLGYVGLLARPHAETLGLPVAVGFDDGDAYVLTDTRRAV